MEIQSNKIERFIAIDLLKTISIFGVVFIHTINGNIISEVISELFRFAVPIFITLFVYFLEKSLSKVNTRKEYYSILRQKFLALFLPYMFFSIGYFFIFHDASIFDIKSLITKYFTGYGWSGQYFFIILFQLIILYPLIQRIVNLKTIYIVVFSVLLYFISTYFLWNFSIVNKISDRLFIYWLPYAFLGIILFRNVNIFKNFTSKYLIIFFLLFIPIEFIVLDYLRIEHSPYILISVLMSSTFIAIYIIVDKEMYFGYFSEKLEKSIIYYSKRTLGIFVLNPLIIFLIKPYFKYLNLENIFLNSLLVFIYSFIVFILCILIIKILEKTFMRKLLIN